MNVRAAATRLLVTDLEACLQFYRDAMEFPVITEDLQSGYVEFKAGEMRLSLFRREEMAEIIGNDQKPSNAECQDRVALVFTVASLDETCQQLKAKGIEFTREPTSNPYYGIKTAYLRDPDGTLIGLFQMLM